MTVAPNYWKKMIDAFTEGFVGFLPDELDPLMDPELPMGLPSEWFGREQPGAEIMENPLAAAPQVEQIPTRRWMNEYKNGKIPVSALSQIPGGGMQAYMRPDAAAAFIDMYNAAKAAGVNINVTSAYRSYSQQSQLVAQKGLYSQGGWAAAPGTSNHGWGLAVDVSGEAALKWLNQHGHEYGFTSGADWSKPEPWHWEYTGSYTSPAVSKADRDRRRRTPRADPGQEMARAVMRTGNPDAMFDALFATFKDEASRRHGKLPAYVRKGDEGPNGGVKRQLWQGFMDAGRKDLARMVYTKDFDAWIRAESGWRQSAVSQIYVVNGVSGVNGGLFQIRYPAHPWAHEYFSQGNSPASSFTASAYEQAMLIAQHFPGLTPEKIRMYARQVRSGGYHGWP